MDPDTLSAHFQKAREVIREFQSFAVSLMTETEKIVHQNPIIRAALGYVLSLAEVDFVICGVNRLSELEGLLSAAKYLDPIPFSRFAIEDLMILDPRNWP
jgi:aryl-alcohol dehydrogenase-like predicted oxidoreductase